MATGSLMDQIAAVLDGESDILDSAPDHVADGAGYEIDLDGAAGGNYC
jgi:hypothetical protein